MGTRTFQMRPYARLLTMIGDQLIKNERIAITEIIKNSYDADADWVKITFKNFGDNYEITSDSKIIIEDNGCGMDEKTIIEHWMNPATPLKEKRKKENAKTKKGRIIQGEKGIGRFALLKLGRCVDVISRMETDEDEYVISYRYDGDHFSENEVQRDLFLDDLPVTLVNRAPERIVSADVDFGARKKKLTNHGTVIEISDLKGRWTEKKVKSVYRDLAKLKFSFLRPSEEDFEIVIYKDAEYKDLKGAYMEDLHNLLSDRYVIKIEKGHFDAGKKEYQFKINGEEKTISLFDAMMKGLSLKAFRDRLEEREKDLEKKNVNMECGSFDFEFYIFDFSAQAPPKYKLNRVEKSIIKDHRIYLYRDSIRVYPYGEPDDDWLRIDMLRGTSSAGAFLSNDQVVGRVDISQEHNPHLKDKTNREGLIEHEDTTEDFIAILQTFLSYIRQKPYDRYRIDLKSKDERKKDHDRFAGNYIEQQLNKLMDMS